MNETQKLTLDVGFRSLNQSTQIQVFMANPSVLNDK